MRPADTSPEAWAVFLEAQRRLTPGEKMARAYEFSAALRALNSAGMRARYPDADEHEIFLRVTRLAIGPELFERAYGATPINERTGAELIP